MLRFFSLAIVTAIFFSGCGGKQVYNVFVPDIAGEYTVKQMHNAIVDAGKRQKWKFSFITSNKMIAEYSHNNGKHIAKVDIKYTATTYSIHYLDSVALNYNGEKIHKAYNKWIKKLENEINSNLAKISSGEKIYVTLEAPSAEITVYDGSSVNEKDVRTRLKEISSLYKDGLINKEEYEEKRKRILDKI